MLPIEKTYGAPAATAGSFPTGPDVKSSTPMGTTPITYAHDPDGRVSSFTDVLANTWMFTPNPNGCELNLPTGEPLVYELDDDLQPTGDVGPGGVRGRYLDPERAVAAADAVARQAG